MRRAFSSTSGGSSEYTAAYDATRGIVPFIPPPTSGTLIDNFAPTSTPTAAAFTTTGDTTANTGAVVYSLILDAGVGVNLVDGPNPPSATNNNTPTGTLAIGGGFLTAKNGAKLISRTAGTTSPTVAFGV